MRPQTNPRASWPSHDDNGGFVLVILIAGLAVLAAVTWVSFHGTISAAVMAVFRGEIAALRPVTGRFDPADHQMMAADPVSVRLRDLYGIAHDVGMAVRVPVAALMLALAALCTARAAPSRFRRALDMDGLIAEQAKSFPSTAAFVHRRLGLLAPASPPRPADLALTAEEWVACHATRSDGSFDEVLARRALAAQLGPPWCGVEQAAPPVRAMFAVFALHLVLRRDEVPRLLGVLSASLAASDDDQAAGPDCPLVLAASAVARADEVLRDYAVRRPAARVAADHAYAHTALMSVLNASRLAAGVLAPGQFAWLKLVDRPLWYALHALGYETEGVGRYFHPNPRVEAAGARDHWAAERAAAGPIRYPDVERATQAILKAVSTPAHPSPDRDAAPVASLARRDGDRGAEPRRLQRPSAGSPQPS